MKKTFRRSAVAALASLLVLGMTAPTAQAQRRPIVIPPLPTYHPNPYITPYLTLQQYAYNLSVLGRAYANIPPYMLGYNPYPQYLNIGPSYPTVVYPAYPYGYTSYYYTPPLYSSPNYYP